METGDLKKGAIKLQIENISELEEKYIQVGVIATRDPKTGEFLKSIPIYQKESPELLENEDKMIKDASVVFAEKMKQYIDNGGLL